MDLLKFGLFAFIWILYVSKTNGSDDEGLQDNVNSEPEDLTLSENIDSRKNLQTNEGFRESWLRVQKLRKELNGNVYGEDNTDDDVYEALSTENPTVITNDVRDPPLRAFGNVNPVDQQVNDQAISNPVSEDGIFFLKNPAPQNIDPNASEFSNNEAESETQNDDGILFYKDLAAQNSPENGQLNVESPPEPENEDEIFFLKTLFGHNDNPNESSQDGPTLDRDDTEQQQINDEPSGQNTAEISSSQNQDTDFPYTIEYDEYGTDGIQLPKVVKSSDDRISHSDSDNSYRNGIFRPLLNRSYDLTVQGLDQISNNSNQEISDNVRSVLNHVPHDLPTNNNHDNLFESSQKQHINHHIKNHHKGNAPHQLNHETANVFKLQPGDLNVAASEALQNQHHVHNHYNKNLISTLLNSFSIKNILQKGFDYIRKQIMNSPCSIKSEKSDKFLGILMMILSELTDREKLANMQMSDVTDLIGILIEFVKGVIFPGPKTEPDYMSTLPLGGRPHNHHKFVPLPSKADFGPPVVNLNQPIYNNDAGQPGPVPEAHSLSHLQSHAPPNTDLNPQLYDHANYFENNNNLGSNPYKAFGVGNEQNNGLIELNNEYGDNNSDLKPDITDELAEKLPYHFNSPEMANNNKGLLDNSNGLLETNKNSGNGDIYLPSIIPDLYQPSKVINKLNPGSDSNDNIPQTDSIKSPNFSILPHHRGDNNIISHAIVNLQSKHIHVKPIITGLGKPNLSDQQPAISDQPSGALSPYDDYREVDVKPEQNVLDESQIQDLAFGKLPKFSYLVDENNDYIDKTRLDSNKKDIDAYIKANIDSNEHHVSHHALESGIRYDDISKPTPFVFKLPRPKWNKTKNYQTQKQQKQKIHKKTNLYYNFKPNEFDRNSASNSLPELSGYASVIARQPNLYNDAYLSRFQIDGGWDKPKGLNQYGSTDSLNDNYGHVTHHWIAHHPARKDWNIYGQITENVPLPHNHESLYNNEGLYPNNNLYPNLNYDKNPVDLSPNAAHIWFLKPNWNYHGATHHYDHDLPAKHSHHHNHGNSIHNAQHDVSSIYDKIPIFDYYNNPKVNQIQFDHKKLLNDVVHLINENTDKRPRLNSVKLDGSDYTYESPLELKDFEAATKDYFAKGLNNQQRIFGHDAELPQFLKNSNNKRPAKPYKDRRLPRVKVIKSQGTKVKLDIKAFLRDLQSNSNQQNAAVQQD
ncbi:uncharacterized protein LOC142980640 isoform X2 [Anticarsia gemmatalis]|uniref:uncharacterized protein LOC142980640 isoform X2 n=1 Tax=Anticarsia gemmatalis TaxID=129554 RepID=UPI003F766553